MIGPILLIGALAIGLSACHTKHDKSTDTSETGTPGTLSGDTTLLYPAGQANKQEVWVYDTFTTDSPLFNVQVTLGFNPSAINPSNEGSGEGMVDLPDDYSKGLPPLFLTPNFTPDMGLFTDEVSVEATTIGDVADINQFKILQVGDNNIKLSWPVVTEALSYAIYNITDISSGAKEILASILLSDLEPGATTINYNLANLTADTTYNLQVAAVFPAEETTDTGADTAGTVDTADTDSTTTEQYSDIVTVPTTKEFEPQSATSIFNLGDLTGKTISNLTATPTATSVLLEWDPIDAYSRACLDVDGEEQACIILSPLAHSAVFTGGAPDLTVTGRVLAFSQFVLETEKYSGIDLTNPESLSQVTVNSLSYSISGGASVDITAQCTDFAAGCTIDIGDIDENSSITFNGLFTFDNPAGILDFVTPFDPNGPYQAGIVGPFEIKTLAEWGYQGSN